MCTSGVMYEFEEEQIEDSRIQKDIEASLVEQLEGWGFDMDSLRESEGGVFSLDRRSPRADFTNVHPTYVNRCEYSGLRSTSSYMER
jgi:hypothetical protein